MQADDEHQMDRSISVSSSQVPHQLQLRDADLEESDGAAERSSPDCVIVKEKDPASGLSRRLKHITMGEKNVSEVIRPSSSKHCLPTISEETNQNGTKKADWNMISSSSMEGVRSVSHRSSDSEDCSLLHSPSYYEKDSYKNMMWGDDETSIDGSGSDSRSISRTSSFRSEIPILSESNPLYEIEKDLIKVKRKVMSLLPTERNKVGVVPQGMRVQKLLRRVDNELELARKIKEGREVWLPDLLRWRRKKLKQSIIIFQERVVNLFLEVRGMLINQISMQHGEFDEIRRQILLKSKNIVAVSGFLLRDNRLDVATALSEALNLVVCFDTVIWVRVSDCVTVEGIRHEIAKALDLSLREEQSGSEYNRLLINNFLAITRFLLVLDHLQPSLNDLEEIGIPHASKLSESGSIVVVITKRRTLNNLSEQAVITVDPISIIREDVQFVLNAEEGLKWYRLDEVRQLHRLLFGDHLFHGVKDGEDSNHLILHLQVRSHLLMQCREDVLLLNRSRLIYVELPRTLNPQSWFVRVDRAFSRVRELKQGEAPPPRLMESMIQLEREGQILYNSIECGLFFEDNLGTVKELDKEQGCRKFVAITGESGIGKTRLLAEIVKEWSWRRFSNICAVVLITVSDGMTCPAIQEKIAEQLTMSVHFNELREKVKGGNLIPVEQLRDRENLLLLDDVRSILDLDRIKIFGVPILQLPNIKIVMTSRQKEICKEMGAEVVLEVPLLSVEKSKRLVKNTVGENYERMDIVNKLVELYGGGLPRRLIHIGNTIKDATLEDLMLLLDHPQEAIKKFSVGDHGEDEVCRYFLRRTKYSHVAFYSWDQITKAFDDMHIERDNI